jgi:uncharacterized membrane protein
MKTISVIIAALCITLFTFQSFGSIPTDLPGDVTGVSGKVVDKNTGECLAGASVIVKGTNIRAYTDLDGNFSISNLEPGTYDLEISYISYQQTELAAVKASAGEKLNLEIAILPE